MFFFFFFFFFFEVLFSFVSGMVLYTSYSRYCELANVPIGHFRVDVNLIIKARLSAKFFVIKIGFHSYANKTNFHMKNFCTL